MGAVQLDDGAGCGFRRVAFPVRVANAEHSGEVERQLSCLIFAKAVAGLQLRDYELQVIDQAHAGLAVAKWSR